ncbi:MAG: hypothetical protein VX944_01505 [Myxococcota bacterium]|nr:hypothetical protein [Myxococcota bacterium]
MNRSIVFPSLMAVVASAAVSCSNEALNAKDTGGTTVSAPALRPPGLPSDGACPAMNETGTDTFSSGGRDRTVTMVVPSDVSSGMPLVYFFHGLLDPRSIPIPTSYMANGLRLQALADELGVVFALPQAGTMTRMGFQFYLWDLEDSASADIQLYDDLRACAHQELGVDLRRVHAIGNSGGALFTTVLVGSRADTLASIVELSGGSDIDMLTFDEPLSAYRTPAVAVPSLLVTGGATDQWPGGGMTLIDFDSSTKGLAGQLSEDGHYVVLCEHQLGHTVPPNGMTAAEVWVSSHAFGEPSPLAAEGIQNVDALSSWCVEAD